MPSRLPPRRRRPLTAEAPGALPEAVGRALVRAQELGFLGDPPIDRQVEHALGFAAALEAAGLSHAPTSFLDLGSGGGIPGLVLAAHWPESRAVLLDANERRCAALEAAVASAGWSGRVVVVHDRAERAGHLPSLRGAHQVVVARSFAIPAAVAECGAPFLEVGGLLAVSEPPAPSGAVARSDGPEDENRAVRPERWPEAPLAALGLRPLLFHREAAGYQVLLQTTSCPSRYPRREGVPTKRPLYR